MVRVRNLPIRLFLHATTVLLLAPLTAAAPLQRRDSSVPVYVIGIVGFILCSGVLAVPFWLFVAWRRRKHLYYRLAHGEKIPTQGELYICWERLGPKVPYLDAHGQLTGGMIPVQASQKQMEQLWLDHGTALRVQWKKEIAANKPEDNNNSGGGCG